MARTRSGVFGGQTFTSPAEKKRRQVGLQRDRLPTDADCPVCGRTYATTARAGEDVRYIRSHKIGGTKTGYWCAGSRHAVNGDES